MKLLLPKTLLAGLVIFTSATASALNIGDKIHYTIFVNNLSANTVIANGKPIAPRQVGIVANSFENEIRDRKSSFSYPVKITGENAALICSVVGHVDISIPGSFSMYAENSNPEKCKRMNGMHNGLADLYLQVTVQDNAVNSYKLYLQQ